MSGGCLYATYPLTPRLCVGCARQAWLSSQELDKATMPTQFSVPELAAMDRMVAQGHGAAVILARLRALRSRAGGSGPGRTAVYNFLEGKTHSRAQKETRGRKKKLTSKVIKSLNKTRLRLQKAAENQHVVTWSDIQKEGFKDPHVATCAPCMLACLVANLLACLLTGCWM